MFNEEMTLNLQPLAENNTKNATLLSTFHEFRSTLISKPLYCASENMTFIMEKPDRQHLTHMIKYSVIIDKFMLIFHIT